MTVRRHRGCKVTESAHAWNGGRYGLLRSHAFVSDSQTDLNFAIADLIRDDGHCHQA